MQVISVKTPIIKPKDNLADTLLEALEKHGLKLEDDDIVAAASKAVATVQGRTIKLDNVRPSKKAITIGERYSLEPQFVELVLCEAEKVYGGVEKALITLKNGALHVNAGIDHKNAPRGLAIMYPIRPQEFAETLRDEITRKTGKNVGVVIVDSGVAPLRIGTHGTALAVAGFKPVSDRRGKEDLFQKPLVITRHAVADDLAAAAHLLMGETDEKTPFILIRNAPIKLTNDKVSPKEMQIPLQEDVYAPLFKKIHQTPALKP